MFVPNSRTSSSLLPCFEVMVKMGTEVLVFITTCTKSPRNEMNAAMEINQMRTNNAAN